MIFRGTAWKLGDHVDTDVSIPALLVTADAKVLAPCFEIWIRPQREDHAGRHHRSRENFGQGRLASTRPSRSRAWVSCIIAKSYARIFFPTPSTSGCRF
jgi:3-isopropylmalate/(R)-2-methylmalate dehydratase small subunit